MPLLWTHTKERCEAAINLCTLIYMLPFCAGSEHSVTELTHEYVTAMDTYQRAMWNNYMCTLTYAWQFLSALGQRFDGGGGCVTECTAWYSLLRRIIGMAPSHARFHQRSSSEPEFISRALVCWFIAVVSVAVCPWTELVHVGTRMFFRKRESECVTA